MILALVDEAVAAGARLGPACELLGLEARTVQRWRKAPEGEDQRRGPRSTPGNALSPEEQEQVLAVAKAPEFSGLSPHQLVPKLADMGLFLASESSFYRLLRRAQLLRHRDRARPPRRRPREHVARAPNDVWAWDITYLQTPVRGVYWYLYLILDVWSRKIVGWAVHEQQSDTLAAALVEQTCEREKVQPGLVLHADNGGAMKGKTMLVKLEELGIMPSFSRPRVSDDNPYPEALFRTLKYRPAFPERPFVSIEAAKGWISAFVSWYNEDHQHSGIRFVTPSQRHDGREAGILAQRHRIYTAARARRPERWTGDTRNWTPIAEVRLNPEHGHKES